MPKLLLLLNLTVPNCSPMIQMPSCSEMGEYSHCCPTLLPNTIHPWPEISQASGGSGSSWGRAILCSSVNGIVVLHKGLEALQEIKSSFSHSTKGSAIWMSTQLFLSIYIQDCVWVRMGVSRVCAILQRYQVDTSWSDHHGPESSHYTDFVVTDPEIMPVPR